MAGICNTCKYFEANVRPDEVRPHYCDLQDEPVTEEQSRQNCEECVPRRDEKTR